MEISELQRSATTFRRQGSSGLIWDDKLIQEELNKQTKSNESSEAVQVQDQQVQSGTQAMISHHQNTGASVGRSSTGAEGQAYRTVNVSAPVEDPPSPKVSGCCGGIFGKQQPVKHQNKSKKKRS